MPLIFNVFCCCECGTYQVQQVKKSNKWVCKMCGVKQSVKKVYGSGSAPDCRHHVQKLNLLKSQGTVNTNMIPVQSLEGDVYDGEVNEHDDNDYSYNGSEYDEINECENGNKVCNRSVEKSSYSSPNFSEVTRDMHTIKNGTQYQKQPIKRSAAEILSIIGSAEEITQEGNVKRKLETNCVDTSSSVMKETYLSSAEKFYPIFQMQATNSKIKNTVTEHGIDGSSTAQDFDFLI